MFWQQAQFAHEDIDNILQDESCCLEMILLQPSFLQDVKANLKLQNYLCSEGALIKIIDHCYSKNSDVIIYAPQEEDILNKLPFNKQLSLDQAIELSFEVLLLNSWTITQSILSNEQILDKLFIEPMLKQDLDSKILIRYSKIFLNFLQNNFPKFPKFVHSKWDILFNSLLKHFNNDNIIELILRLWCSVEIQSENEVEFTSTVFVQKLIGFLDPNKEEQLHDNTLNFLLDIISFSLPSQLNPIHPTTALVLELLKENNINKLIEYINIKQGINNNSSIYSSISIIKELLIWNPNQFDGLPSQLHRKLLIKVTKLIPILKSISEDEQYLPSSIHNTTGTFIPLGKLRLQIAEVYTQLLKALFYYQNLHNSLLPINFKDPNNVNKQVDELNESQSLLEALAINDDNKGKKSILSSNNKVNKEEQAESKYNVEDVKYSVLQIELIKYYDELSSLICKVYLEQQIVEWMIDMFFNYKWNNFYHTIFIDLCHILLHWNLEHIESQQFKVIPSNGLNLIKNLLNQNNLIDKMILNYQQPSGNFGFILQLATEINLFLNAATINYIKQKEIYNQLQSIKQNMSNWDHFYNHVLLPERSIMYSENKSNLFGSNSIALKMNIDYSMEYEDDDEDLDLTQEYDENENDNSNFFGEEDDDNNQSGLSWLNNNLSLQRSHAINDLNLLDDEDDEDDQDDIQFEMDLELKRVQDIDNELDELNFQFLNIEDIN